MEIGKTSQKGEVKRTKVACTDGNGRCVYIRGRDNFIRDLQFVGLGGAANRKSFDIFAVAKDVVWDGNYTARFNRP